MNKGLEALELIRGRLSCWMNEDETAEDDVDEYLTEIEKELKKLEKQDKVLKIIKRCPYEVANIIDTYITWDEYAEDYYPKDRIIKNKNEFDLLIEVLL